MADLYVLNPRQGELIILQGSTTGLKVHVDKWSLDRYGVYPYIYMIYTPEQKCMLWW